MKSDLGVYLKHNYIQRAFLFFMYWSQNLCQMCDNGCDYSHPELPSQPPNPTQRSFGFCYSDSVGMCSVRITCGEKSSNIRFVSGNLSWHICSTLFFSPLYVIRGTLQHLAVIRGPLPGVSMPKTNRNLESVILGDVLKHTGRLCTTHGLWKVLHLCGRYLVTWAFWHSCRWSSLLGAVANLRPTWDPLWI